MATVMMSNDDQSAERVMFDGFQSPASLSRGALKTQATTPHEAQNANRWSTESQNAGARSAKHWVPSRSAPETRVVTEEPQPKNNRE